LQFANRRTKLVKTGNFDTQKGFLASVMDVALKLLVIKPGIKIFKQGIFHSIHTEQGGNAFMNRNIKVIKKNAPAREKVSELRSNSKQKAREMVSNVANWVTDLQTRKRAETKTAIEKFFSTPQPSES